MIVDVLTSSLKRKSNTNNAQTGRQNQSFPVRFVHFKLGLNHVLLFNHSKISFYSSCNIISYADRYNGENYPIIERGA